jgi:hypothetical protein
MAVRRPVSNSQVVVGETSAAIAILISGQPKALLRGSALPSRQD